MSECLWAPGRLRWVGTGMGTPWGQSPRQHGALGSPGLLAHACGSAGSLSGFLCQMGRGGLLLPEPKLDTLLPGSVTLLCSLGLWGVGSLPQWHRARVTRTAGHSRWWGRVAVQSRALGPAWGCPAWFFCPLGSDRDPLQPCPLLLDEGHDTVTTLMVTCHHAGE